MWKDPVSLHIIFTYKWHNLHEFGHLFAFGGNPFFSHAICSVSMDRAKVEILGSYGDDS